MQDPSGDSMPALQRTMVVSMFYLSVRILRYRRDSLVVLVVVLVVVVVVVVV